MIYTTLAFPRKGRVIFGDIYSKQVYIYKNKPVIVYACEDVCGNRYIVSQNEVLLKGRRKRGRKYE